MVVLADAARYAAYEAAVKAEAAGGEVRHDAASDEATAKRRRAINHALAEYELKAHTIEPNRPLGEVLIS